MFVLSVECPGAHAQVLSRTFLAEQRIIFFVICKVAFWPGAGVIRSLQNYRNHRLGYFDDADDALNCFAFFSIKALASVIVQTFCMKRLF